MKFEAKILNDDQVELNILTSMTEIKKINAALALSIDKNESVDRADSNTNTLSLDDWLLTRYCITCLLDGEKKQIKAIGDIQANLAALEFCGVKLYRLNDGPC